MDTPEPASATLHGVDTLEFRNTFAELPPTFFTHLMPTPLRAPYLVGHSSSAAALIQLDPASFTEERTIEIFTGNQVLAKSQPLAAVYSGHQFGAWAGQLGDGRAILLGEVPAYGATDTGTLELQLKGAGLTPYSRMGDDRAVLRSSIREFLCSEAMAALGIPTSRALCVTGSDEYIMRETPETAAVATRMAPSFVRFGSFEHWFYAKRHDELKVLADYILKRHFPELIGAPNPYREMLATITRRTAHLIAQWQAVGFLHGVMNTDIMSILGLTLDYGPFGFMEAFDAEHICNHSDTSGRYAYSMQPQIGHWNCYALGQAMLPLIGDVDEVHQALACYKPEFAAKMDQLLHAKLGLATQLDQDQSLIDHLFGILQANHVDFTHFFRKLGDLQINNPASNNALRDLFIDRDAFDGWAEEYRSRLRQESSNDGERQSAMHAVNPKYILRNYLAQVAIEKAQNKDFSEIDRLLKVLEKPFDEQDKNAHYANLPPDWASELEVSCSS